MPFPIFKIFSGQFRASGNSTPSLSEAEKLLGSSKKKSRLPPEEWFLEPIRKKVLVGRAMLLEDCVYRRLRKTYIYGNQGLINNLGAKSICKISIKTPEI